MKYLYRHLNADGEVFYIGVGSYNKKGNTYKKKFRRAFIFDKSSRSKSWIKEWFKNNKNIEVQILKVGLSSEIEELETILIYHYGRRDLDSGCLVNKSNGAFENESGRVFTEKHKENISLTHWNRGNIGSKNHYYGKNHTEETLEKMRGERPNSKGRNHYKSKIVVNLETGIFYESIREVSEAYNIEYFSLRNELNKKTNKTSFKKL